MNTFLIAPGLSTRYRVLDNRTGATMAECETDREACAAWKRLALADALGQYEQAERIATLLGRDIESMADKAYLALTDIAIRCGHNLGSSEHTALSFAKKAVG
jgi:hypothetical protein